LSFILALIGKGGPYIFIDLHQFLQVIPSSDQALGFTEGTITSQIKQRPTQWDLNLHKAANLKRETSIKETNQFLLELSSFLFSCRPGVEWVKYQASKGFRSVSTKRLY
jgi:hypothetical protein